MAHIRVSIIIDRAPSVVWHSVEDIASHVNWMADAVAIRFTSASTSGVGTTFDCETKIGPIRLTDRMEIIEWVPGATMGVSHVGAVTGKGRFELRAVGDGHTEFIWEEELAFPLWMGGPIGARVGAPVMKRIWRRNLEGLKRQVENA
ncbi:MAG: SRPBCC family protein [Acidimicrobiales bacterium]